MAFARAERTARKMNRERRYVYVPGDFRREAIGDVWKQLSPTQTLLVDGDQDVLPPLALDRVRHTYVDGFPVLRLVSAATDQPISPGRLDRLGAGGRCEVRMSRSLVGRWTFSHAAGPPVGELERRLHRRERQTAQGE